MESINKAKEEIERIFGKSAIDGDIVVGKTYSTDEYDKFSFFETNRDTDKNHVKRLEGSVKMAGQLNCPILVSEDFKIIDGQHRFKAWKNLGLPIIYSIGRNYGEREIQLINNQCKSWTLNDFLRHYAAKGLRHYQLLENFLDKNKVKISVAGKFILNPPYRTSSLKAGNFSNNDWSTTYEYMKKYQHLLHVCSFEVQIQHRDFVGALVSIFGNKNIDHSKFVKKCLTYGHTIKPQTSSENYLLAFEKMYNRKVKEGDKVKFFERRIGH